ncbi:MAG: thiolase family protein [Alphaproteobacteria bacterium]|nr:thiolase family protein [Alphaproteobacteria bacterium]
MTHPLRGKAAVTGIGETAYSRGTTKSGLALQMEASLAAIADAGLKPADIDGIVPYFPGGGIAEDFIANLGLPDLKLSAFVPMGGASLVAALQMATIAVSGGVCRHVLISVGRTGYSGARVSTRLQQFPQFALAAEFEAPVGVFAPAQLYAPGARRHMALYGTTPRHFAEIAVTIRRHAILNGNAVMTKELTVEEHHASRMIADPFRLFDCSLESDGGAALVVSATDAARDLRQPVVQILGMAEGHPDSPASIAQRADLLEFGLVRAAPRAYAMAGVGPADMDLAQIYDCFTFTVINQLENLGFCKPGEAGPFVMEGRIGLGGALPLNTHGGLLSQGHVVGLNHAIELVRQLRGQAGRAQVAGAEVGLVTGYGDMGDGALAIMARAA